LNKIYKNKISKGKKHEKRKQPQEKSSTSGEKIKLTKSNTKTILLIIIFYKQFEMIQV
jgi:hypothetical protein